MFKRNLIGETIYVLNKDEVFGVKYNKVIKNVRELGFNKYLIHIDRIKPSPFMEISGNIQYIETRCYCVAKEIERDNNIVYLNIIGGLNE